MMNIVFDFVATKKKKEGNLKHSSNASLHIKLSGLYISKMFRSSITSMDTMLGIVVTWLVVGIVYGQRLQNGWENHNRRWQKSSREVQQTSLENEIKSMHK